MAVNTKRDLSQLRELSGTKKTVVLSVVGVLILFAIWSLLSQTGVIGGPDIQAGYYALQVNQDANASQDQITNNNVFGFEKLAMNADGTFRLGFLRGTWKHSGSTLTLNPQSLPAGDQFYNKTSMHDALMIMLKSCDFTVSADGKTLTAVNAANGPIIWNKVGEVLKL